MRWRLLYALFSQLVLELAHDRIVDMDLAPNVHCSSNIVEPATYYKSAGLIITRAGRNSLSELAFLGIPAIAFVTGDEYRKVEQKQNISNLKSDNIRVLDISTHPFDILPDIHLLMRKSSTVASLKDGSAEALRNILKLLKS